MGVERHLLGHDAREAKRLRAQRVALVVAQRLGRRPRQAVGAQLAGEGGAVFVDHAHLAQHAIFGTDRHGRSDAHADGTVRDRRGELGHKQIRVWRALVGDDLCLRRGWVAVAGGQPQRHGGNQRDRHQPGTLSTRTGHRPDLPHALLHLAPRTRTATIRCDSLRATFAGGAPTASLPGGGRWRDFTLCRGACYCRLRSAVSSVGRAADS